MGIFVDYDATDANILFMQYVSDPITAQTIIAQGIKLQMQCGELAAANNLFLSLGIRVVSSNGGTVRGTILAVTRDDVEAFVYTLTDLQNRSFTATSSEVVAQNGDRLVVEIGMGGSSDYRHTSKIFKGDSSVTDLPENDTSFNQYNPWLEFEQTLIVGNVLTIQPLSIGMVFENLDLIQYSDLIINDMSLALLFGELTFGPDDTLLQINNFNLAVSFESCDIFRSNLIIDDINLNFFLDGLVLDYLNIDLIPEITLTIDDYTISLMEA